MKKITDFFTKTGQHSTSKKNSPRKTATLDVIKIPIKREPTSPTSVDLRITRTISIPKESDVTESHHASSTSSRFGSSSNDVEIKGKNLLWSSQKTSSDAFLTTPLSDECLQEVTTDISENSLETSEIDIDLSVSRDTEGNEEAEQTEKPRRVKRSYTREKKQEVMNYVNKHSALQASKTFGIPRSTISRWFLPEFGSPSKRKNSDNSSYPKKVDNQIIEWINNRKTQGIPVTTRDIQFRALMLIRPHKPNFKASRSWVLRFMSQNKL